LIKQGLKILLAEPNRYQARLISGELSEKFPSSLISVRSCGQAALGELRRATFDIAILSLDLPDVDGLAFVELLRKENPGMLIIVTGESAPHLTAAKAVQAVSDAYVTMNNSVYSTLPEIIHKLSSRSTAGAKKQDYFDELQRPQLADLIRITAGTLYHEINNPLMTILGMTELILGNGCERIPAVAKKLRIIQRSARRIQSTLTRMSAISHPAIRETVSGKIIDPKQSRVATKSRT